MEEWGAWECPACGEEHEDPDTIYVTSCGKCGIAVQLSTIDDTGRRDAWVRER